MAATLVTRNYTNVRTDADDVWIPASVYRDQAANLAIWVKASANQATIVIVAANAQ